MDETDPRSAAFEIMAKRYYAQMAALNLEMIDIFLGEIGKLDCVQRWKKFYTVPYEKLPEVEKQSLRENIRDLFHSEETPLAIVTMPKPKDPQTNPLKSQDEESQVFHPECILADIVQCTQQANPLPTETPRNRMDALWANYRHAIITKIYEAADRGEWETLISISPPLTPRDFGYLAMTTLERTGIQLTHYSDCFASAKWGPK